MIQCRKELVGLLILGLDIFAPVIAWLLTTGSLTPYVAGKVPPGQFGYVLSKLAGLLAFAVLWIQVVLALSWRIAILDFFPSVSRRTHAVLGSICTGLVLLHLALFFQAVTVRTGTPAWGLLIPDFDGGYYQGNLSLGKLGFYGLIFVVLAGVFRMHRRPGWRCPRPCPHR